jgi:hypothetical protein
LNAHGFNNVRHTEIHTAGTLMPELSVFGFELAIEKLNSHEPPATDQIPAEFIKAGGRTIRYEIHKLVFLFCLY